MGFRVFDAYLFSKKFGFADKEVWAHSLLLSFGLFSPDGEGRTGFECWHTRLLKTKFKWRRMILGLFLSFLFPSSPLFREKRGVGVSLYEGVL